MKQTLYRTYAILYNNAQYCTVIGECYGRPIGNGFEKLKTDPGRKEIEPG
jgi:hypothetical protein